MTIENWYESHFESRLTGRYITLEKIKPILHSVKSSMEISVAGVSEKGADIPLVKVGHGKKVVLGWSQMHGNESTTTKAVFDFFKFMNQEDHFSAEILQFKEDYTFYVLPMLNPDGAAAYTRENANGVDLNRDAKDLSQKESVVLKKVFEEIKPTLCLNLHDQRTIYGVDNGLPATVSFLSPAADQNCQVTEARKVAMHHIVGMTEMLQQFIPGQIGRYDDTFNANCVGDSFQQLGVPTILFEAGHYANDYQREKTRSFIFYAMLQLFGLTGVSVKMNKYSDYFNIPENEKNYTDILLHNVKVRGEKKLQKISILYQEKLESRDVRFIPKIDAIGQLSKLKGHREIDVVGAQILINSQENYHIGQKVLQIKDKKDDSTEYFTLD